MKKSFTLLFFITLIIGSVFSKNIYVSASRGTNDGDGTMAKPLLTISSAVEIAESGDVIVVQDGIFRETVNVSKSNISITAENDDVYITGTDIVSGFEDMGNGLYKAYVPQKVSQLFIDGVPQVRAKYPNQNPDPDNLFNFTTFAAEFKDNSLTSDDITQPDGFFNGATIWMIVGDRWVSETAKVVNHKGNVLQLKEVSWNYEGFGIAFISNCKNCLDNDGEWYWGNDTLYYKNSSIDISNSVVEAKTRETLFDVESVENVKIDGINGYAGNVLFNMTKYCKLSNGEFKYLTDYDYFGDGRRSYCRGDLGNINSYGLGVALFGSADTVYKCKIEYSAGDCVTLYGNNNVVSHCTIHDANYRGNDCGAVSIGGWKNQILFCEAYNAGRDLISASNAKAYKILYNELYRTGLIAWDLGIIYTWGTDGAEAEIAYNHISEAYSGNPDDTWGAVGVYLDNGSQNYLVHHNVIHNIKGMGMQFNYPGYNLRAYHNTIYNTARDMGAYGSDNGITPGKCKLYNNYSDKRLLDVYWTDTRYNFVSSNDYLQDRDNGNFVPKSGTHLINTGMFIDEMISVPFSGDGPDLGAYEYGRVPWETGPDSKVMVVAGDKTLKDVSGLVMRGTPMVIGKNQEDAVHFAMNQNNWKMIKNNGFNTVRVCWVDPWYKDRGKDNWSVSEVLPYLDTCVMNATASGMNIIINFHNPGAQDNYDTSFSFDQEKSFWSSVAARYKDNNLVYFELTDEPTSDLDKYENSDFKNGLLDVYESVRTLAPDREILMFSFNTIDNQIVEVVEEYKDELNLDKTSVAYHMYNLSNSAAVRSLMTDYKVICTQWNYNFVGRDNGNDILEVDGYKENAQTLEMIGSSWVDWRAWEDTTLNELLDTLITDARSKDYWWGKPVPGIAVTCVNILQDTVSVNWGVSKQLTGKVCPALSENQNLIWSTSDPNNVFVDDNGYVTTKIQVKTDTVAVYATSEDGGYRDSCMFILGMSEDKCAYPNCEPHVVPGEINATYFDKGGEGVGYHDVTQGNGGDGPRQDEDVDTDYRLEEGSVMGIETDEWLEYTIDVKKSGDYIFEILFATTSRYGKFHIEIDGVDVSDIKRVKTSGSFDKFKATVVDNISLTKGLHLLRIYFDYAVYNMGTITINAVVSGIEKDENVFKTRIYPNPVKDKIFISSGRRFKNYSIYALTGQLLVRDTFNEHNSIEIDKLPHGYYILRLSDGDVVEQFKFIKN